MDGLDKIILNSSDVSKIIYKLLTKKDLLLTYLIFKPDEYYRNEEEIMKRVLDILNKCKLSYEKYKKIKSLDLDIYSLNINTLKELKLIIEDKDGYRLSKFGEDFRGFAYNIYKNISKIKLDLEETIKNTRIYDFLRIVNYIKKNENIDFGEKDIRNYLNKYKIPETYIIKVLRILEDSRLIYHVRDIYNVKMDKAKEYCEKINNKEIDENYIKEKTKYEYFEIDLIKDILKYIVDYGKSTINAVEILDYENKNMSIYYIERHLDILELLGVLEKKIKNKDRPVLLKVSKKFYEFYENIIKPIASVLIDVKNIEKYKYYISEDDIKEFIQDYY
ncbi:hypothetical protein YN1_7630 [Nanoarchaeota archaeon]